MPSSDSDPSHTVGVKERHAMRLKGALRPLSVFILALLLLLPSRSALALTVGEILSSPDRFDQKDVTLVGTAEDVRPRVSRRGNQYTTLKLADGTGRINVFSWGKLAISSRDRVEVKGIFLKVKRVGRYTFRNEIEASSVKRAR